MDYRALQARALSIGCTLDQLPGQFKLTSNSHPYDSKEFASTGELIRYLEQQNARLPSVKAFAR